MLALGRTFRPAPRLKVDAVEPGCRAVAGAFRCEAATGETSMAMGGLDFLTTLRAADVPERALP
ncbi:MAG: hypothetical protein OXI22_11960 [Defluviicoccus sp.]|nr:hypothetical protein [Defluviicoccus sp.]MDE0384591.1 hypothetical protein [Defluviicoccus sp.]